MFLSSITDRGATPALVKTMAFAEAKLRVVAENVANQGTPHYKTRQLDTGRFQAALRKAFDRRESKPNEPFVVDNGHDITSDDRGFLKVNPLEKPAENILFHDGTNMSMEAQMAELAKTGLMYEQARAFLQSKYETLRKAISSRV